jgi:hypothetical protein
MVRSSTAVAGSRMAYAPPAARTRRRGPDGEGRVGADDDGLPSGPVSVNDGEEELVLPVSAVDVARPELGGDAVAVLVDDEERVVARSALTR